MLREEQARSGKAVATEPDEMNPDSTQGIVLPGEREPSLKRQRSRRRDAILCLRLNQSQPRKVDAQSSHGGSMTHPGLDEPLPCLCNLVN